MNDFYRYRDCYYDWVSDSPIINDLPGPVKLCAEPDVSDDNGTPLRVYGFDAAGKRIRENDLDGFLVPVTFGSVTPSSTAPAIARIDRVSKGASKGYIKLSTLDLATNTNPDVILGYFQPDETEPNYRRMRISEKCAVVRIGYRKRTPKINSLSDMINLRSRAAIVNAVKAYVTRLQDPAAADAFLVQAVQLLRDEQSRRDQTMPGRPIEVVGHQDDFQEHAGLY